METMKNGPENELLSAYLDGEATPQERAEVEKLIASDPAARSLLDELQAIREGIQNLPAVHLGKDLCERVLQLAERQMLLEQPTADRSAARPTPGSLTRSIARRLFQPRAIIRTALILLVAAGLYVFDVRGRAKPVRQVAVAPPVARERGLAEPPQLHAAAAEKRPTEQGVAPQEAIRVESVDRLGKDMPAAAQFGGAVAAGKPARSAVSATLTAPPPTPSSGIKKNETGAVARAVDEGRKRPSATSAPTDMLSGSGALRQDQPATTGQDASRKLVLEPVPLVVASGDRDKAADLHRRVASDNRATLSYGGTTGGKAGGQEQEKAAVGGALSPDQDVLVVKLVVAPQALERQSLERLLAQQQIVTIVAKREPAGSQYVGDAAPEKFVALLKELRSRKVDFPSVVEESQAANSVLPWGAMNGRSAAASIRLGQNQFDETKQQLQNARPLIQMQQQAQLGGPPDEAAKAVLDNRRVRFLLQVTPAELSTSAPPAAASPAAKAATRSNPLRRAAGPGSNTERSQ